MRISNFRHLLALIPVIIFVPGAQTLAATSPGAELETLAKCFVQAPQDLNLKLDMDCGYVSVPAFHQQPDSPTIKLGYMRLKSDNDEGNSPLFILTGGPGQSLINAETFSLFQPELLGKVLRERDIVLMDQRGTEHTLPYLNCAEAEQLPWRQTSENWTMEQSRQQALQATGRCITKFEAEGVDFSAYNSVENAADINDVRLALGYPKIIYYGASYGTLLGQHLMRDYPQILESVILDGTDALSRKSWVEDRAQDAQAGIDQLGKLCEADRKCSQAYDIPALIEATIALFDDGPLSFEYIDTENPDNNLQVEITLSDMIEFIYGRQASTIGIFSLPALLDKLAAGGRDLTTELLGTRKAQRAISSRSANHGSMARLMHLAVVCAEDPVNSIEDIDLHEVGRFPTELAKGMAQTYIDACKRINVKRLPDSMNENVSADIPTLVLSGKLDVATPVFRSQEVVNGLPNARHVIFPRGTHVQLSSINLCATDITRQFISNPAAILDISCTENIPPMGFVLPDGSMSIEFDD